MPISANPIVATLQQQRQREEALRSGSSPFPLAGGDLAGSNITSEGPGVAATNVLETALAEAGANTAAASRGVEEVSDALAANPTTADSINEAAASTPTRTRFKDLPKGEKLAAVLNILGNALAVHASNDPGAAVQRQLSAIAQEKEIIAARNARAAERREDREFARDQFERQSAAQRARDERLEEARVRERREAQEFDLKRDMERFLRDSGFRREQAREDREFRRQERQDLRAEDRADTRQQRISQLTMQLAPNLATLGENAEGQRDPLGRARRIAAAIIDDDIDSLSDFDRTAFEFSVRKHDAPTEAEQRKALIDAATRLVGKPQPVPRTKQVFLPNGQPEIDAEGNPVFEIEKDPATGMVLPRTDALGNIVEVPMSFEEALTAVAMGMEQREFFNTRTPDPAEVEHAEQMQSLVVDPASIKPEHLLDSEGRLGLISAVAGHAQTGEERREIIDQFEQEMISRGFSGFSSDVKKVLEAHYKERDKAMERAFELSDFKKRRTEDPVIRSLRQTGFNEDANRRTTETRNQ